jgi:hypothetical protein
MADIVATREVTEENIARAREFARLLLLHVGPMMDEMKLTCTEAELAFACLLAESLSQRSEGIRKLLIAQWQDFIGNAPEQLIAERSRGQKARVG